MTDTDNRRIEVVVRAACVFVALALIGGGAAMLSVPCALITVGFITLALAAWKAK